MKAVEVRNGIYWVGAIDWAVRDFHGYETPRGTSYNNYLIMDEKPTLIDTVKYDFADASITSIKNLVDLSQIKQVVINHIENDHASAFDRFMELMPQATVYMTERAKKGLERFFDLSKRSIKTVKSGETLSTGKKTLLFLETPMLHWPDSMVTYVKEDKVLISQDAFGQHIASSARFDDEFVSCQSMAELEDAVLDYYANILMPFGSLVKGKIAEIQKAGLEIDIIAPDHGIIWRANPGMILTRYMEMAEGRAKESVSIIYDTMWHSTELMTQRIARGISDEGLECKVMKLRATPMSVAVKEFWRSRGTLVGSPTMNNILFPTVAQFLAYLRGLRPKNRLVSAFGSFGWGGGAVKEALEALKGMGLETVENGLQVQFRPSMEDEEKCYEFGRTFAQKVKAYHSSLERS